MRGWNHIPRPFGAYPRHSRTQPPTLSGATPDTFAQKCILSPCKSVYTSHQKEYTLHTRKSIHFGLWRVYSSNQESILSRRKEYTLRTAKCRGFGPRGWGRAPRGADIACPGGVWHNDRIIENLPASGGAQAEHRRARQGHRSKFHSHSARSFQNAAYYPISRRRCKRNV